MNTRIGLLVCFAMLLSACGGGGSGGGSTSISANRSTVAFTTSRGAPAPAAEIITVSYVGAGVAAGYKAGVAEPDWLDVTVDVASPGTARFSLHVRDLIYRANRSTTLTLGTADENGQNIKTVDISVTLTVNNGISLRLVDGDSLGLNTSYGQSESVFGEMDVFSTEGSWTLQPSEPWVRVSRSSGTGDARARVTLSNEGLAPGNYEALIRATDSSGREATLPVRLNNPLPMIEAYSGPLQLSGVNGADLSTGVQFALRNRAEASWSVSVDQPWLQTTVSDGNWGGTSPPIAFKLGGRHGLASGEHSANATVTAVIDGYRVSRTFPVALQLYPAVFGFDTQALDFVGISANDMHLNAEANLGTGANSFAVEVTPQGDAAAWLQTSASVSLSESWQPLAFQVDTRNLSAGDYRGSLRLRAQVNGDVVEKILPVSVKLESRRLFVPRNGLAFSSLPGSTSTSAAVMVEDTAGNGGYRYQVSSNAAWLSANGSLRTGEALTVDAEPTGLVPGLYEAALTLTPLAAAVTGSEIIRVGLYVSDMPASERRTILDDYSGLIVDPVRPYVYAPISGSLRRVHVYTGVQEDLGLPVQNRKIAIASDGSRLYLPQDQGESGSSRIKVYALPELTAVDDYAVSGGYASDLMYARPSGYPILLSGGLSAVDASNGRTLLSDFYDNMNCLRSARGDNGSYAVSANGRFLITGRSCAFRLAYTRLNGGQARREPMPRDFSISGFLDIPVDVAINDDGSRAYTSAGSSIAGSAGRESKTQALSVSNVLQKLFEPISTAAGALAIDFRDHLYASHQQNSAEVVSEFNRDGELISRMPVSSFTLGPNVYQAAVAGGSMRLSSDGLRLLWVQPGGSGSSFPNTSALTVVARP